MKTIKAECHVVAPMREGGKKIGEEARLYADGQLVHTAHLHGEDMGTYREGETYEVELEGEDDDGEVEELDEPAPAKPAPQSQGRSSFARS